jgi:hypothetical protein
VSGGPYIYRDPRMIIRCGTRGTYRNRLAVIANNATQGILLSSAAKEAVKTWLERYTGTDSRS